MCKLKQWLTTQSTLVYDDGVLEKDTYLIGYPESYDVHLQIVKPKMLKDGGQIAETLGKV